MCGDGVIESWNGSVVLTTTCWVRCSMGFLAKFSCKTNPLWSYNGTFNIQVGKMERREVRKKDKNMRINLKE
jgi:hypothetical protein